MNETKTSIQAIKSCQTIGDLLKLNGRMQELNKNKEITFILEGNTRSGMSAAGMYAEDLVNDLNLGDKNPHSFFI